MLRNIGLRTLHEHQLYTEFSNCEFWLEEVRCLGNIMRGEGIMVGPNKVEVVMDWKQPTIIQKIRTFLGLVDYCCIFVEGFSKLSSPLVVLTRKDIKFFWTERCERSFEELKYIEISRKDIGGKQ